MKKILLLSLVLLFAAVSSYAQAGDDRLKEINNMAKKEGDGWVRGGGIGLDLAGMGLKNPRVGAGQSRFGVGGLGTLFANKKGAKWFWENNASLQLSAQRLGKEAEFVKSLDMLRLGSRYGHKLKNDKLFFATDALFETLVLKTYQGNLLKPATTGENPIAKIFSPARFSFSPGLDYRPNEHWSYFLAPVALRLIYVADDEIAKLGVHGNEIVKDAAGNVTEIKNSFLMVGANAKIGYKNKFLKDRIAYTSNLDLFSNYRKDPQNIDLLWQNNVSIAIFKGLSLDLLYEAFYDDNTFVQKDGNKNGVYSDPEDYLGKGVSSTGAFLLKYSRIF